MWTIQSSRGAARAVKATPDVALPFFEYPAERLAILNGFFNVLVRMSISRHCFSLISLLLVYLRC